MINLYCTVYMYLCTAVLIMCRAEDGFTVLHRHKATKVLVPYGSRTVMPHPGYRYLILHTHGPEVT